MALIASATGTFAGIEDGPDPIGTRVSIVRTGIAPSATVEILDATTAKFGSDELVRDTYDAIQSLIAGNVDGIVIALPMSACDDTQDCSREISETCKLLGGRASATEFSAANSKCTGTCTTGHAVSVACVTLPNRPR